MLTAHTVCSAVENFLHAFLRRRLEPCYIHHLTKHTPRALLRVKPASDSTSPPTFQDSIVCSRLETCIQYSDISNRMEPFQRRRHIAQETLEPRIPHPRRRQIAVPVRSAKPRFPQVYLAWRGAHSPAAFVASFASLKILQDNSWALVVASGKFARDYGADRSI